jgi:hypothetical protein
MDAIVVQVDSQSMYMASLSLRKDFHQQRIQINDKNLSIPQFTVKMAVSYGSSHLPLFELHLGPNSILLNAIAKQKPALVLRDQQPK